MVEHVTNFNNNYIVPVVQSAVKLLSTVALTFLALTISTSATRITASSFLSFARAVGAGAVLASTFLTLTSRTLTSCALALRVITTSLILI